MKIGPRSLCTVRSVTNVSSVESANYFLIKFMVKRKLSFLTHVCVKVSLFAFFAFVGTTFSCDWPQHARSVIVVDETADICCCGTPSGDKCNWLICLDCFDKVSYDLKASHQKYGLQVKRFKPA